MADNSPINPGGPTGAEPMKKSTGRVQPKKETVRINLPPKPTAAPTIKLPTLPPGGPTGVASAAPAPPTPPSSTALRSTASPTAQRSPASTPSAAPAAQRPASAAPTASRISPIDKALAIAAAVVGLVAIGTTVWMMFMLNNALNS